jgi:hypothetical protein
MYFIVNKSLIKTSQFLNPNQSCPQVSNRNPHSPFRESPNSCHSSCLCVLPCLCGIFLLKHFRPRTSVLNLPIPLRHRFFLKPRANSPHDRALPSPNSSPPRVLVVRLLRVSVARIRSDSSRGHTWRNPLCFHRRLLLQLLPFQNENRLRENV